MMAIMIKYVPLKEKGTKKKEISIGKIPGQGVIRNIVGVGVCQRCQ